MSIFQKFNKILAATLGLALIAITLPFICPNMSKVVSSHSHIPKAVTADSHINTAGCCNNSAHSNMHYLSNSVSDIALPISLNNSVLFILIAVFSFLAADKFFIRLQTFSLLIGGTRLLRPPLLC